MAALILPDLESSGCYRLSVVSSVYCEVRQLNEFKKTIGVSAPGDSVAALVRGRDDLALDVHVRLNRKTHQLRVQFGLGHRAVGLTEEHGATATQPAFESFLEHLLALGGEDVSSICCTHFHFDRPEYESAMPLPIPMPGSMSNQMGSSLGEVCVDGLSLGFRRSKIGLHNVKVYLVGEKGLHVDAEFTIKLKWDNELLTRCLTYASEIAQVFVVKPGVDDGKK